MTYRSAIDSCSARLDAAIHDAGEARAEISMALMWLKNWKKVDLAVHLADDISDYMLGKLNGVTDRLIAGEPIQYIMGYADFYGLRFTVRPGVLIPRPETAELVDMIAGDSGNRQDLRVLDICTGSGCIAIALARNLPFADVTAIDLSDEALETARENAKELHARVDFVKADALRLEPDSAPLYDIIVSNPPYIPEEEKAAMAPNVLLHEPAMALFVPDDDPLRFYTAISAYAAKALKPGGRLYYEINPRFAEKLVNEMKAAGWRNVRATRDSFGHYRFISATCAGADDNGIA